MDEMINALQMVLGMRLGMVEAQQKDTIEECIQMLEDLKGTEPTMIQLETVTGLITAKLNKVAK